MVKKLPQPEPPFLVPHHRNPLLRHADAWIDRIRESFGEKDQVCIFPRHHAERRWGNRLKRPWPLSMPTGFGLNTQGGVFWLQMENGLGPAALSFLDLAEKSGVKLAAWRNQPEEILINIMLRYLDRDLHKLIILDNLSDSCLPRELPKRAVHMIVTTRHRSVAGPPMVEMVLPDEPKALDIFLAYANQELPELSNEDRNGAIEICRRVERLPLALEILGQLSRRQPGQLPRSNAWPQDC